MIHLEGSIDSLYLEVKRAFENDRHDLVVSGCQSLIRSNAYLDQAFFFLGVVSLARHRPDQAVEFLEKAVSLNPNADYVSQLARTHIMLRDEPRALQLAQYAEELSPRSAITLDTLGCVYSHCGNHDRALKLFERAVAISPPHPELLYNLATAQTFLGYFDDAERRYEEALVLYPRFAKAHAAISKIKKQTISSNHITRLRSLMADADKGEYLHIGYALAKEYEDIQDHAAVTDILSKVNTRRKKEINYDISRDASIFDSLKKAFSDNIFLKDASDETHAPIFVLGMPRTGTTLVDRIISSHPEVESLGELQAMPLSLKRLAGTRSRLVLDVETITLSSSVSPHDLARSYMKQASVRRKSNRRFIDKLPLNFLYIGYILKALPQSKIICLRRNPMDTVWSNYKQLFSTKYAYYDYSYDINDAAVYYKMFDDIMSFWKNFFPHNIHEVHYETLIDAPESEIRSLLEFCDLSWNEACLSFHETHEPVATPSMRQVRQPIYRSSVGRWIYYKDFLNPAYEYFKTNNLL